MRNFIVLILASVLLVGCSEKKASEDRFISEVADVFLSQPYKVNSEKSVNMYIEHYQYGQRAEDKVLNFGAAVQKAGAIQLSLFRLGNPADELLFIGAIGEEGNVASAKRVVPAPSIGWVSVIETKPTLQENEATTIGAIGFFEENSVPVSLTINEEDGDFVTEYAQFKTVYVVVVDVR